MPSPNEFRFTLSQIASIIGKSPRTLRTWDSSTPHPGFKAIHHFPRHAGERKLTASQTADLAKAGLDHGRIPSERYKRIVALLRAFESLSSDKT